MKTKLLIKGLFLILCLNVFSQETENSDTSYEIDLSQSVVELRITTQEFDYHSPWQRKSYNTSSISGIVIGEKLIITKSHSILQHVYVEASKLGQDIRYPAQVIIKDYNTGLALITVQDPDFFSDLAIAEIAGYDFNGKTPVVSSWDGKGIFRTYLTEMYKTEVLFHETGASLFHKLFAALDNPKGGEPLFQNGKLIGITQWYDDENNILTAISSTMIVWMVYNVSDGIYEPQPNFFIEGTYLKSDENLRNYLGLSREDTGIYIDSVPPLSSAYNYIQEGDVLLSIDGVNINDNGLCDIEPYGPMHYMWLIIKHFTGEEITVELFRNREKISVSFQLLPNNPEEYLIEPFYTDTPPEYYISGGLLFQELSAGLLNRNGSDWRKTENRRFIYLYDNFEHYPDSPGNHIVILNRIIPLSMNSGYEHFRNEVLVSINNTEINNLTDVKQIIENSSDKFIVFDFLGGGKIVLEKDKIDESISELEENYNIEQPDNL
jgi:S1-C subfamily serine protease